jgi:hypothetical protein
LEKNNFHHEYRSILKCSTKYIKFGFEAIVKEKLIISGIVIIFFSPLLGMWDIKIKKDKKSNKNPFMYTFY